VAERIEKALEKAKRYNWRLIYERWEELPPDLREKLGAIVAHIMGALPPELEGRVPEYMRKLWEEKVAKPPPAKIERVERRPPETRPVPPWVAMGVPPEAPYIPPVPPWFWPTMPWWRQVGEAIREYHERADSELRPNMSPDEVLEWYDKHYGEYTRLPEDREEALRIVADIYKNRCELYNWPIPEWVRKYVGDPRGA